MIPPGKYIGRKEGRRVKMEEGIEGRMKGGSKHI